MNYPCLKINLSKIANNCRLINDRCASSGITVVGVSKCIVHDKKILQIMFDSGINKIGDSRLKNLKKIKSYFNTSGKLELCLLRTPMMSEIKEMIKICEISMNTQAKTVKKISEECILADRNHKIIIMVETDDRREGLLPDEVIPFCKNVLESCPGIIIWGIGTNARCMLDKSPKPRSLQILVDLKQDIEKIFSINIPVVSGGNSSVWGLLEKRLIPKGVNQLRIGEAIFLGHETAGYGPIAGTYGDAFILEAEIIEVKRKNGKIYRVIVALGLQDAGPGNICCTDKRLSISGQSSDHTVLEYSDIGITDKSIPVAALEPGDILSFNLNYFGLLSCFTSPFVYKQHHW